MDARILAKVPARGQLDLISPWTCVCRSVNYGLRIDPAEAWTCDVCGLRYLDRERVLRGALLRGGLSAGWRQEIIRTAEGLGLSLEEPARARPARARESQPQA